jgi:hypothetical protein
MGETEFKKRVEDLSKSNAREGVILRSSEGKYFFIGTEEMKKAAVEDSLYPTLDKLFGGAAPAPPVIQPHMNCVNVKKYLDTHDPNTEDWRRMSLDWLDFCLDK